MRKKQPEFKVYKATKPNGNRRWYIIGRPQGQRIRAWFATKEAAEAEANERNLKMRRLGDVAVTLDHDLLRPPPKLQRSSFPTGRLYGTP